MFDLQPCVHFHEKKTFGGQRSAAVDNEFYRASTAIPNRLCRPHRSTAHRVTHRIWHMGRRRLFHNFLMAALQGAIALVEMHRGFAIAKNLYFNVAGV